MLFIYYFVLLYCIYDMSICIYIEREFAKSSCTPVCLRLYKYNLVLSLVYIAVGQWLSHCWIWNTRGWLIIYKKNVEDIKKVIRSRNRRSAYNTMTKRKEAKTKITYKTGYSWRSGHVALQNIHSLTFFVHTCGYKRNKRSSSVILILVYSILK
jgi:hypothetical protein